MTMTTNHKNLPYVAFVSAFINEVDNVTNMERTRNMNSILEYLKKEGVITDYRHVCGYYKGNREVSYMITFEYHNTIKKMISLGYLFDQECILVRTFTLNTNMPQVYLIDTQDGPFYKERTYLGTKFVNLGSQAELMARNMMPEACTIMDNKVWVVR